MARRAPLGGGGGVTTSATTQVWKLNRGMLSGHSGSSSTPRMQHALPDPQKPGQFPLPPHGSQQFSGGDGGGADGIAAPSVDTAGSVESLRESPNVAVRFAPP